MPELKPGTQKAYMYFGMVSWTIIRWGFFAVTYFLVFSLGTMEGSFWQRVQQLKLPKVQINMPFKKQQRGVAASRELVVSYYTILVGSHFDQASASTQHNSLTQRRVNSHTFMQNGKYFVCVGKFNSSREANSQLQRLRSKGFENAIVVGPSGQTL